MTAQHFNALGQPIGTPLPAWQPPPHPPRSTLAGRFCRLEPLDPARDGAALWTAYQLDSEGRMWTYLPYGPFASQSEFLSWLESFCMADDPLFYTIFDTALNQAVGLAAYLRIAPAAGSIEVGHLLYSPLLQRKPAATEAMYLMMRRAFELGYRRYEWKCDSLNAKSRAAAERLGFLFEGIFRQAIVYKGRNRDTCWFSVIDSEWPAVRSAFEAWLAPSNFDDARQQQASLQQLIVAAKSAV